MPRTAILAPLMDLPVVGDSIKPVITTRQLEQLALELYALRILDVESLGSYDNLNFHIIKAKVDDVIPEDEKAPQYVNPNIRRANEDGYVLKIVNTHTSVAPESYDMQMNAMMFLKEQGLECPEPVKSIEGKLFQQKTLNDDEHGNKKSSKKRTYLISLLTYIPGRTLMKHPNLGADVFFEAGQFAGRVTMTLQNFDHNFFKGNSRSIWDFSNSSYLRKYIFAIPHTVKRKLISDIFDAFEANVVPYLNEFQPGVIHGDLNAENILFCMVRDKPAIRTIIDFGDMNKSYAIFDLATCMTHLMLLDKSDNFLVTGGQVLQGFSTQVAFNEKELQLLPYMVLMRYATVVTLCQYTVKMEPKNDFYVIKQLPRSWTQLKQMWETDLTDVLMTWQITA